MEEGLLVKEGEVKRERLTWGVLGQEVKRLCYIAGPMVAVTLSEFLLQVISLMMVGHLGELSLSSTAIAVSLCGVTGFSLLLGMASALETLCGQAYGAQQFQKLGTHTYTAIFCLLIVCIPLSIIWMYLGKILALIGQDPLISHEAGIFATWLIPALFGYATLQPLVRYFQMQSLIFPMLLETSVLSVCLNTIVTLYAIPYGLAAAVSTRVSNELGAGNPEGARVSVVGVMVLAVTEVIILDGAFFASRHVFGYVFSSDKDVVDYVTTMAPLVCLSVLMDSLQGTLSGVARGCGWQHIGAYVNLASFYLLGIPIALTLGFVVKMRGKGLWILSGATVQSLLLFIVTICTNWEKQAIEARERLFQENVSAEEGLM